MTVHLNEEQLINYIYQALPDAEREALDLHLSTCPSCRVSLADHETWQRRVHYSIAGRRRVTPSSRMSYAAIAPRLKRTRRFSMIVKQSNQFIYGALTVVLLVAVGAGLYFFVSNLSRPTPAMLEEVKQPTSAATVVSQPTIKPAVVSAPEVKLTATPTSPLELVWSIKGDPNPLDHPVDITLDSEGNLYVVDGYNHRIQKFDRNGQFLTMWGSEGNGDGQFNFVAYLPHADGAVAVDKQGYVYVADTANRRIQKFDRNGQFLTKWGRYGSNDGEFEGATGVAVDGAGYVYVADFTRDDIQKFDENGQFLTKFGGPDPEKGGFYGPSWLAVDAAGNVYVADDGTHQIHKFDGNGQFLTRWGNAGSGDDPFSSGPDDVAVDEQGNIYVMSGDPAIQVFDNQGRFLFGWGSSGSGEDQFSGSGGLAVDEEGNIYVADYDNNRVQKFRQPGWADSDPANDSQPAVGIPAGELKWKFNAGSPMRASPTIADGLVYFGNANGFYALDSETGQEKWRFETGKIYSTPAVAEGMVYFGSTDTYLYALDSHTGQEQWKFKTGLGVASSPVVANGVVYFGSDDRHFYAVDAQTGQEKWRFKTEDRVLAEPTVAGGLVYFGSYDGYYYALDIQTGQEKWKFNTGLPSLTTFAAIPVDGTIYLGSYRHFHALDSQTGQEKWQVEIPDEMVASRTVADGTVYAYGSNGLYALDSQTGQEKWRAELRNPFPIIVEGVLYVGTDDSYMYALDSQTGQELWKFKTDSGWLYFPTFAAGVIYFGSPDGYLYAVR